MYFYTNEAVFRGHPDKMCDQISDAILDCCLSQDPLSRVACEVAGGKRKIFITGEITTEAKISFKLMAKNVLIKNGIDAGKYKIIVNVSKQSQDIDQGVSLGNGKIGAGDNGMMFGYATNETRELLPKAQTILTDMIKKYDNMRMLYPYLFGSDGKCQLTGLYDDKDHLKKVKTIVFNFNHKKLNIQEYSKAKEAVKILIVESLGTFHTNETKILINPTGKFEIGGFEADAGLTGRKIIVDTYGGYGRHGGGSFSGKDPTKVDRSASYAARWVAKNLVAAGVADKLEIQLAYAIGVAKPVSIAVDTFNTGKIENDKIVQIVNKVFDLRPSSIIKDLNLRRPIYRQVAAYGHFGRTDIDVPWEKLDKVDEIKKYI